MPSLASPMRCLLATGFYGPFCQIARYVLQNKISHRPRRFNPTCPHTLKKAMPQAMSREPAQRYPDILASSPLWPILATDDANSSQRGIALDLPVTTIPEIDTVTLAKMALSSDALTAEEHIFSPISMTPHSRLRIVKPPSHNHLPLLPHRTTQTYPFLPLVDLHTTIFPSCHIGYPDLSFLPLWTCHNQTFPLCHIGTPDLSILPLWTCHNQTFPLLPLWTCQTYPFSWISWYSSNVSTL